MADEPKRLGPGFDLEAGRARFDYIKGNAFRVIHVDGLFGGNSPRLGYIHMAIWSERWPIPKQMVHEVSKDGEVGTEIYEERVTRSAVVREVEAQLVMDINTAKQICEWLQEKIQNYEDAVETHESGVKE